MLLGALLEDGDHSILPLKELEIEGVGEVQLRLLVLVETFVGLPRVAIMGELTFVRRRMVAQNHGQEELFEHLTVFRREVSDQLLGVRVVERGVKTDLNG